MMVTISNDESILKQLHPLLSGSTKVNKVQLYTSITDQLRDEDTVEQICEEIGHRSSDITAKVCQDVESADSEVAMAALQFLGVSLHSDGIVKAFSKEDCLQALQSSRKVVNETSDKTTCTRALWCLASKAMAASVLKNEVESILDAIECALYTKNFQSMTVEHEGLNAIIRLLEQVPEEMTPYAVRWAKLIYPLLLHGATKVRERAVVAMDLGMPLITQKQEEVGKCLMLDLKNKDKKQSFLLEQLTKFMDSKQEVFAMRVWEYYVRVLGRLLHHGQLINQLLPFVEQAFKNSAPPVKCAAYRAWSTLINNFGLNLDILADGKRVKLVMQVFKLSNAKVESVAMEKLSSWWLFLRRLGPRASSYFDTVAVPLLNFCAGGLATKNLLPGSAQRTPTMSRLGMLNSPATPNQPGSPLPKFRALQLAGAQVLGRILGPPLEDPSIPQAKFSIEPLEEDLIAGPLMFVKHSAILVSAVKECISTLQDDLQDGLLYHIWYSIVAHVKNVLEFANKKDAAEVLSTFLTALQQLVASQSLPPEKLLKLLQAVLCLPSKALSSSSYAIGTSQTGMMQGTPVLFLLDLLFNHRMLETSADHERFFVLMEKLIACGMSNSGGALSFLKAVLQLVDQAAPKIDQREAIWRMWSLMINPLLEHILKTNEVNAGDALEHDFSCMYAALQLPLLHLISSDFSTHALKSMLRTWTELYTTFARLAALVTNAEANVCCEELSSRIVAMLENNPDKVKDMACVDTLSQVCQVIIGQFDFSQLKGTSQFNATGLLSPGKFMAKKKQRPLGNIHSFVKLVGVVTEGLHQAADTTSQDLKPSGPPLQIAALAVIDVLTTLFSHLPSSGVVAVAVEKLAPSTSLFYSGSAKKPPNKMYSQQVLTKLEKLWLDIVTCIQARYQGQYDSDFLAHMSPLLEATFLHPRRPIKNQTAILWNASFAHATPLTYPVTLKTALVKVKEKTPISLPGWDAKEIMQVDETQISQMSQGAESQVPLPNIAGLPSPHKAVGSFMNKVASPEVKKSPLKRGKSPPVTPGARKKLGLEDMKSQDFVVITPTTRRSRVLTQHQREVLRERKVLPAMYNNLDASQDNSMMSHGNMSLDSSSVDVSQIPFSFSAANKTSPAKEQKTQEVTPAEPAAKEKSKTEKTPASRRRSVTFAPSPAKFKATQQEKESSVDEVQDESEPVVLFGQAVVGKKKEATVAVNIDDDVAVIPETECTELSVTKEDASQGNILVSQSEASEANTQDSEKILVPKSEGGRTRKSRAAAAESQSTDNDSDECVCDSKPKGDRRRSPRKQPPKAQGMKKLDNWFSLSPKKEPNASLVLVEETQHSSPTKMKTSMKTSVSDSTVVVETPSKMEEEGNDTAKGGLAKATKQLFEKNSVVSVPESELVLDSESQAPSSQGFVIDSKAVDKRLNSKPVVQLARISLDGVKPASPQKKNTRRSSVEVSSDDGVFKVTGPTEPTTVVRKVRRRSSIKFSKASQEKTTPLSPVNMDDVIPSSQDAFAFRSQTSPEGIASSNNNDITKTDSVILISQTERDEVEESEKMDVDLDETVDVQPAKKGVSVAAVVVDMKDSGSDSGNPVENPDIIPADLSASSQDSQATLVGRQTKKRRRKGMLSTNSEDSIVESSQNLSSLNVNDNTCDSPRDLKSSGRSSRRRSMPSKFKDSEVYLTPEKGRKKKTDKDEPAKLRPADTLAEVPHDESVEEKLDSSESQVKKKSSSKKKSGVKKSTVGKKLELESTQDEDASRKNKNRKTKVKGKVSDSEKASVKKEGKVKVESPALQTSVNKDCNLDIDSDAEDDIPISLLGIVRSKKQEVTIDEADDKDDEDDVALIHYKRDVEDEESETEAQVDDSQESQKNSRSEQPAEMEDDLLSVEDIFETSAFTSTPSKSRLRVTKRKRNSMVQNLSIDMRTSPLHIHSRSKGNSKLNRSLNSLQRRRRSPGSPFVRRHRSKSVSPRARQKLNVGSRKIKVKTEKENADSKKDTELSSGDGTEAVIVERERSEKPQGVSRGKESPVKSTPESPRRSPRKAREESPQKYSLSPTRPSLNQSLEMPETPTSATKHQSRALLILERSRLFASRSSVQAKKYTTLKPAAPGSVIEDLISPSKSILKPTIVKLDTETEGETGLKGSCDVRASPPPTRSVTSHNSPTFRPVQIPRVYSPAASPSAGILKKRKLTAEVCTDSPSPPNKQRRVSFNEAVDVCTLAGKDPVRPVNRCLDMPAKSTFTTSPLVAFSKVTSNQSKFLTSSKPENNEAEKNSTGFAVPHPVNKKKEAEPSQNSVRSTAESQLNCEDPIFPELLSCMDIVDHVLPQLTTSTWVRGVGQLLRSKNIRTVGDLSALTEYEVNNLPIRTPKVAVMRQVLSAYAAQIELRKPKVTPADNTEDLAEDDCTGDTPKTADSPSATPLPSLEEALAMSPIREADTSMESLSDINLNLKSDDVTLTSEQTASRPAGASTEGTGDGPAEEEVSCDINPSASEYHFRDPLGTLGSAEALTPSEARGAAADVTESAAKTKEKPYSRDILKKVETVAKMLTPEVLAEMPPSYLVEMHLQLNAVMTKVIMAQSDRCPLSPRSSQMSQSQ